MQEYISRETGFLLTIFILGQIFGTLLDFYNILLEYDTFMHFVGGALVSSLVISFLIQRLNRFSYSFNVFFTLGIGAIWEVFEFLIDNFLGFATQGSLEDTMIDLIVVFSAAVIINFIYWIKHERN